MKISLIYRILLNIALAIVTTPFFAQNGIRFENDSSSFDVLLQKAKNENKIIFIDCYTSWCGPCKWMEKNIFTDSLVADFYNKNFICMKVDLEKGEGLRICRKYSVRAFPTFLFINKEGKLWHKLVGENDAFNFIKAGAIAMGSTVNFYTLNEAYEQGNRKVGFLLLYLEQLNAALMPCDSVIDEFFKIQTDPYSKESWEVINKYIDKPDSKQFQFLVENREKFESLYGDEVSKKIRSVERKAFFFEHRKVVNATILANIIYVLVNIFFWGFIVIRLVVRRIRKLNKEKKTITEEKKKKRE